MPPLLRTVIGLVLVALLAGCDGDDGREDAAPVPRPPIQEVLADHTDTLMALPGVVGTAIGLCDDAPCIQVFVVDSAAAEQEELPERLEGYPVRVEVTGPFRPRGS